MERGKGARMGWDKLQALVFPLFCDEEEEDRGIGYSRKLDMRQILYSIFHNFPVVYFASH